MDEAGDKVEILNLEIVDLYMAIYIAEEAEPFTDYRNHFIPDFEHSGKFYFAGACGTGIEPFPT